MKISDLIRKLETIRHDAGEVEVRVINPASLDYEDEPVFDIIESEGYSEEDSSILLCDKETFSLLS